MPVPVTDRRRSASPSFSHKKRKVACERPLIEPVHGVKPLGNAVLGPPSIRSASLGFFSLLSDELILHILTLLSASELLSFSASSRAALAFARHEPLWKGLYIQRSNGTLLAWSGSWRKSYVVRFGTGPPGKDDWPSYRIIAKGLFSDVLYQPHLCATLDLEQYFSSKRYHETIRRHDARGLTPDMFSTLYAAPSEPVIITDGLHSWSAYSPSEPWSMQSLASRFPSAQFQAEAFSCSLAEYLSYSNDCAEEDAPLYLFDSAFVESTGGEMGREYSVLDIFSEDLFSHFGSERPNYRWVIIGPARSGSTFHKDPNGTSAWNAVVHGRKGWVMFPADILPPGVFVSQDEGEVTSPLSIAEWFEHYFKEAWRVYGPNGIEFQNKGKMRICICEAGEVVYVPSGWWHLVVNLEPSVAVTQNFVSEHELSKVLRFMRDKPSQISGFKPPAHLSASLSCPDEEDEDVIDPYRASLYARFCEILEGKVPDMLHEALKHIEPRTATHTSRYRKDRIQKAKMNVWEHVKEGGAELQSKASSGFSFGFDFSEDFEEDS